MCLARLHAFVKHTDNFDQSWRDYSIVKNVHRPPYLAFGVAAARMLNIKASDARQKVGAISRRQSFWVGRHLPHRRRQDRCVAPSTVGTPLFCARGQNVREVCLRRPGNTKARHRFSVRLYERWPLILRDSY
jgi:hypothetical protein